MRFKLLCVFSLVTLSVFADKTPSEIKFNTWNIHALRYYPFKQRADSVIYRIISRDSVDGNRQKIYEYKKTSAGLVLNKPFLDSKMQPANATDRLIYKSVIKPFDSWFKYMHPVGESSSDLLLTMFLSEEQKKNNRTTASSGNGLFEFVGTKNISYFLSEWMGKADLSKDETEILFMRIKSPLAKDALKIYDYFLSSETEIDGTPVYEVVFFSKKPKEKAFEGYLYISKKDFSLVKSVFTLNYFISKNKVNSILFTQTPQKKESEFYIGNETSSSLLVNQIRISYPEPEKFTPPLNESEKKIADFVDEAYRTKSYLLTEYILSLLLNNRIGIFDNHFDLGPVSQMISYNRHEKLRLRIGGNTSQKLSSHFETSAYLAYGMGDKKLKYRGDFNYSNHPFVSMGLTYTEDLNIPGYDLLENNRDDIFRSFNHSSSENLSFQKIGQVYFKNLFADKFSVRINAKYWYDQPVGAIRYVVETPDARIEKKYISNTELGLSFRYAPGEKYIRLHNKFLYFKESNFIFELNQRVGVKGIFNSDYNYRITDFNIFQKLYLPADIGSLGIKLSGGKVWDRVPFSLLFIPSGNQNFVYNSKKYNLMNFYEFITDRYVAGNMNLLFNWSPISLIHSRSKIKTTIGAKTIYGPLSDNNNPALHPDLFAFNNGVNALDNQPYVETNIGLVNILQFLRLDYVYRVTHGDRGALFVSANFSF
ncbi:collagen-binding protein [Bacteroidia bacterium]|nr:collagen-binding protein [Bacteroidia bacterium]